MKSALSHLLPLAVASACLPADALATGALATGTLTTGTLTTGAAAQGARVWDFRVYLDNAAIGTHRFTLRQQGEERELASEARFEVKLMFFTAYRYAHRANERWRGDCLTALNSRTDDNGTPFAVAKEREALPGCIMSFAYWNPQILRQSRLLNAQTGEHEAVSISALGEESIAVRGAQVPARRYRISGPKNPIELWYSATGEWLALASTLEGGRRLQYRLEQGGQP
jgi:hypothetical protein